MPSLMWVEFVHFLCITYIHIGHQEKRDEQMGYRWRRREFDRRQNQVGKQKLLRWATGTTGDQQTLYQGRIFGLVFFSGVKCWERSIEVQLPAPLGNYDRQTNQPTDGQTGSNRIFTYNSKKHSAEGKGTMLNGWLSHVTWPSDWWCEGVREKVCEGG